MGLLPDTLTGMRSLPDTAQITELLRKAGSGDAGAEQELAPLIYDELRRLARNCMRQERRDHTLQTTALVHEAYLRLLGAQAEWQNRVQFFSVAAGVMRRTLIDYARARNAVKRGGSAVMVSLGGETDPATRESLDKILDVHRALDALAAADARAARIVEMRFFAGLEIQEIADLLRLSTRTVKRDWDFARSWLFAYIAESYGPGSKDGGMSPAGPKSRLHH